MGDEGVEGKLVDAIVGAFVFNKMSLDGSVEDHRAVPFCIEIVVDSVVWRPRCS